MGADRYQRSYTSYQQEESTVCGDYCLNTLKMFNMGGTLHNVLSHLDPHDKKDNDLAITKRIHNDYPRILNHTPHTHWLPGYKTHPRRPRDS